MVEWVGKPEKVKMTRRRGDAEAEKALQKGKS